MNNEDEKKHLIFKQYGNAGRDKIQGEKVIINNTEHFPPENLPQRGSQLDEKKLSSQADIFISYWSAEKLLALLLASWISDVFQKRFTVFVSSDAAAIKIGDRWLNEIEKALQSAKLALILASKRSLERHWINFEAGCLWSRGIPVVFLCHSGLNTKLLPHPYDGRQSLNIEELGFPEQFLKSLVQRFNAPRLPPLNFAELEKQLADTLKLL